MVIKYWPPICVCVVSLFLSFFLLYKHTLSALQGKCTHQQESSFATSRGTYHTQIFILYDSISSFADRIRKWALKHTHTRTHIHLDLRRHRYPLRYTLVSRTTHTHRRYKEQRYFNTLSTWWRKNKWPSPLLDEAIHFTNPHFTLPLHEQLEFCAKVQKQMYQWTDGQTDTLQVT